MNLKSVHIKPQKNLQPFIDRYWSWESADEDEANLPKVLPGTGVDLFLNYGAPFIFSSNDSVTVKPSNSFIPYLRSKPYNLSANGKIGFIAVRFRAGSFRHFSNLFFKEVNNSFFNIDDIWRGNGKELSDKVCNAKTFFDRVQLLNTYLNNFLCLNYKPDRRIDYAVNRIYYGHDDMNLDGLIKELNVSKRQFQRIFKDNIGISPKYFFRLSRFQSTIKYLLLNKQTNYLGHVLKKNYYDQSHFIKDFNHFVRESPSSFLREINFMSHFYNTPLS